MMAVNVEVIGSNASLREAAAKMRDLNSRRRCRIRVTEKSVQSWGLTSRFGGDRLRGVSETLARRPYARHCFNSSWRSKSADAASPASNAQNAELMPRAENGVIATINATKAPKRRDPEKLFSNESCNAPRIARPASAKMYDLGSTLTSAAIDVPAKAMSKVSTAEMTTPQYRASAGPASFAASIATPVRATIAGWPPKIAFSVDAIPTKTETGVTATL